MLSGCRVKDLHATALHAIWQRGLFLFGALKSQIPTSFGRFAFHTMPQTNLCHPPNASRGRHLPRASVAGHSYFQISLQDAHFQNLKISTSSWRELLKIFRFRGSACSARISPPMLGGTPQRLKTRTIVLNAPSGGGRSHNFGHGDLCLEIYEE